MFDETSDLIPDDEDDDGSAWPVGRCVTAEEYEHNERITSRLEMPMAEHARAVEYYLKVFTYCDTHFDPADGDLRYHWDMSFYWLTYYADEVHLLEAQTEVERAIKSRIRTIWPSPARRCRMARPYLDGLSREQQPLYEDLNASYWRHLNLRIEGRAHYENPQHDEAGALAYGEYRGRYEEHWGKIVKLHNEILTLDPETAADRELRRRILVIAPFTETMSRMEWQRRKGIAYGPRPRIPYRDGHLIDPHRLSWG